MVADDTEEQGFVAIMQRVQRDVFFEVAGQRAQVGQHAFDLRLHREDGRGQEPAQPQRLALFLGECGALVEEGIAQQRQAMR